MSKYGEDVTTTLTGMSTSSSTGKIGVDTSVKLIGEQVTIEQAKFNHTKEIHSEEEKIWLTWLNITVTIVMAIIGALSIGDPVNGSIIGLAIGFLFIVGGKYAKNKRIDVIISSR